MEMPSAEEYLERWTTSAVKQSLVEAWEATSLIATLDSSQSIKMQIVGSDDPRTMKEDGACFDIFHKDFDLEEVLSSQIETIGERDEVIHSLESLVERLKRKHP